MSTTEKFAMIRDMNGFNSFLLKPATEKFNTILASTVAQTFTAPVGYGKYVAIFYFEPGGSVWCAHNTTATLPSGSVTSTVSEGNPVGWEVNQGDTISMITNNTTCEVGVKFYAI